MSERTTLEGWEHHGGSEYSNADRNSLVLFSRRCCGAPAPRLGFCGTWMMQELPHARAVFLRAHGDVPLGARRWSVRLGEGV